MNTFSNKIRTKEVLTGINLNQNFYKVLNSLKETFSPDTKSNIVIGLDFHDGGGSMIIAEEEDAVVSKNYVCFRLASGTFEHTICINGKALVKNKPVDYSNDDYDTVYPAEFYLNTYPIIEKFIFGLRFSDNTYDIIIHIDKSMINPMGL